MWPAGSPISGALGPTKDSGAPHLPAACASPDQCAEAGTDHRGSRRARKALKIPVASWCACNAEAGLLEQSPERGASEATACKARTARKARHKVQEMQEMQERGVCGGAELGRAPAARKAACLELTVDDQMTGADEELWRQVINAWKAPRARQQEELLIKTTCIGVHRQRRWDVADPKAHLEFMPRAQL
ncbi:unnamed protein product [Symbiodinium natans]|uniref:Uncharacterized protein n=1 Tax=Symbiodinium natans TaxID=878477 RepID=A0A812MNQ5_9DINO|nr:unnamed protein product [Symbiodinium natans]